MVTFWRFETLQVGGGFRRNLNQGLVALHLCPLPVGGDKKHGLQR